MIPAEIYDNVNVKENVFFFSAWPRWWHKERASVVYNFLAIWLVYSLKRAFLIGCYNKIQLPEEFWIEPSDREFEENTTSTVRIIMIFRRNMHIGICNGAAMEEAIWNGQSSGVWGRVRYRTLSWRLWKIDNCRTRFFTNQSIWKVVTAAPRESTTFWPLWWRIL